MRPCAQNDQRWRLDSSRAGLFHTSKPLFMRASEPGPSTATVSPKPIRFAASFHSQTGKGISTCQQNSTLETSVSKRPVRNWRRCLPKPVRFNLPVWWKTARPDAHADSLLSKCRLRRKPLQQLNSSTVKKLVVVRSQSTKTNHVKI